MRNVYLILLLIIIIGCSSPVEQFDEEQKLVVKFVNRSDRPMNNIQIADKPIGNLQAGGSTTYIKFNEFRFDSGLPDEDAFAEIDGKVLSNKSRNYWCGTEKYTVDSGKYLIQIQIIDTVLSLKDITTCAP